MGEGLLYDTGIRPFLVEFALLNLKFSV